MKQRLAVVLGVIIFMTLLSFLVFFFAPSDDSLISPWIERGRTATNLWFPRAEKEQFLGVKTEITAKAAYFVEINSGEVLYEKNIDLKLPVASLTKIMTAVITLENKDWGDEILISEYASSMEPDHMQLKEGERLMVKELLYGLFLVSGNDAAEALAEGVLGDRKEFLSQMNKKALQLGMRDTFFINPSGLQEDSKKQYSTAYDILILSRYAVKHFPGLVEISSTPSYFIPATPNHQSYTLYSGINLLTTYPGVKGLKTGYTPEAGLTLVTLAEKEGREVLGVLLNSENRREEARQLLDYSFKKLGVK